jgi:hypothetical protein
MSDMLSYPWGSVVGVVGDMGLRKSDAGLEHALGRQSASRRASNKIVAVARLCP